MVINSDGLALQRVSKGATIGMIASKESSIRLAQQQAQLTGSVQPLLAALISADQRVARAAQERSLRYDWSDTARQTWQRILARVTTYADLEPVLLARVEQLIDFVTSPPE